MFLSNIVFIVDSEIFIKGEISLVYLGKWTF